MAKMIDPDRLARELERFHFSTGNLVKIQAAMEAAEVEVPQIVRCKDCKHYNTGNCADGFGWCEGGNGHGSTDDWFCADGEKTSTCGEEGCSL